ncbi:hypothetical protein BGZ76_001734 [Entomortierella beljakovae]|nr:hypothetical protein BGZ76_001734 [Entomortierella beljakovae]
MTSPVELPEILHYIAWQVSLEDLFSCVRVSRLWNTSFTPSLWHTVLVPHDWPQSPSFPSLSTLQKNAHHVRRLSLKSIEGLAPFLQSCNHLKVLVIFGEQITSPINPNPKVWDELTSLIKHNPLIEWIVFGFGLSIGPSTTFLQTLPKVCPNLRRYESSQAKYDDPEQVNALIQVINKLQAVSTRYEYFANVQISSRQVMPHLYELTLKDARGLSPKAQVDLVCLAPSLRTLKWTVSSDTIFPVKEFCKRIPAACPKLRQLQLDGCGIRNPDYIGRMLDSLPPLEVLGLCGSIITIRTFNSLTRHFGSLDSLEVTYCSRVKSWMVQRILEGCPHLTKLLCSVLRMRDIVQGKPWAAVKLERFEVNFISTMHSNSSIEEQAEEQRATFGQLSRLKQLGVLATGPKGRASKQGLQFRLGMGMHQLESLTKLRMLNFGVPFQTMDEDDVIWIGNFLGNLKRVEGIFHTDWDQHMQLVEILKSFGVDVINMENADEMYDYTMDYIENQDEDDEVEAEYNEEYEDFDDEEDEDEEEEEEEEEEEDEWSEYESESNSNHNNNNNNNNNNIHDDDDNTNYNNSHGDDDQGH